MRKVITQVYWATVRHIRTSKKKSTFVKMTAMVFNETGNAGEKKMMDMNI